MLKRKKRQFTVALIWSGLLCLGSCVRENYDFCPMYPVAGKKVAQELEKAELDEAENFWEWMGRVNKLREELELCKN